MKNNSIKETPASRKKIAIVMGGYSSEYEISVQSGNLVYRHLDKNKYTLYRVLILKDRWVALDENQTEYPINKADFSTNIAGEKINFDCVFNAIHGTPGEDGLLAGYFESIGIRQTACDHYQAALTFNKRDCISVLRAYGIKTAINFALDKGDKIIPEKILEKVGLPCFVKANRAGSSFGVSKVKTESELLPAIENSFSEDNEVIIESFLEGMEVDVCVINHKGKIQALPVTEIVSENEFFDYKAKYLGESQEITPARLSDADTKKVQNLAIRIFKHLKLKGLTRTEFIFHKGEPHFIEVNTIPGLSEASIVPQQALAAGISLKELFDNQIELALDSTVVHQ